jgi:hypothetical protein
MAVPILAFSNSRLRFVVKQLAQARYFSRALQYLVDFISVGYQADELSSVFAGKLFCLCECFRVDAHIQGTAALALPHIANKL